MAVKTDRPPDISGKSILVTGGAGFIGSHLVERLVKAGATVRVADNLWRGKLENLAVDGHPLIDLDKGFLNFDLTSYDNCKRAVKNTEIVYHLADVVAGIDFVFENQFSIFYTNSLINTNMLRAAIDYGVKKYVYVGTACSYPKERQAVLNPAPLKEEDAYPANPESSYGWSKLMGEYECELARREGLIDTGVLRLHNAYGPRSDFSAERSQVIPSLIRKAINYPREDFIVWGSGNQRRAFVYVKDIVDALVSVINDGMSKGPIQIGPQYSTSIREIAEIIVSISGKMIDISYDTTKREGDVDRLADWSKAQSILGWSPKTKIEDGIRLTYEWIESGAQQKD